MLGSCVSLFNQNFKMHYFVWLALQSVLHLICYWTIYQMLDIFIQLYVFEIFVSLYVEEKQTLIKINYSIFSSHHISLYMMSFVICINNYIYIYKTYIYKTEHPNITSLGHMEHCLFSHNFYLS